MHVHARSLYTPVTTTEKNSLNTVAFLKWFSLLTCYICIFFLFLLSGDEILAVNGTPLQGLSHAEAIGVFKSIRVGHVVVHAARRDSTNKR